MNIQKGKPLTDKDRFLIDWAKESKKANLILANDVLGKLLGTITAFLGGAVVFLNNSIIPKVLIAPILVLFLFSLALAFIGILPYKAMINLSSPTEIEDHKSKALSHKLYYIKLSALFFLIGLILAVCGVIFQQVCT